MGTSPKGLLSMRINNHLFSIIQNRSGEKNCTPIKDSLTSNARDSRLVNGVDSYLSLNAVKGKSLLKTKMPDLDNSQALAEQMKNVILAHPASAIKTQANLTNLNVYNLLK